MTTQEKIKRMYEVHRVEEQGFSLDEYSKGFYEFYMNECENDEFSGSFDDFVDAGYKGLL